ncbi:MAG: recombinase Cre, partial [Hafnia sp.]
MNDELIMKTSSSLQLLKNTDDVIKERLRLLLEQREAFSPKTFEKILIVMKSWTEWCQANDRQQLPVQPEDFREYAAYLHQVRRLASTSIDSHKTMLNIIHRHLGLTPLTADLSVTRELSIIRRRSVMNGEKTGQAIPLRMDDLLELTPLWIDSPRLADLRNLAALYMSYNTMLRITELARVKVCHLTPQHDGSILVDVPYTKTVL